MTWAPILAVQVSSTGSVGYAKGRIRSVYTHTSTTQGIFAFLDGTTTILSFTQTSSTNLFQRIPDSGIRWGTSCSVVGPAGSDTTVYFDGSTNP